MAWTTKAAVALVELRDAALALLHLEGNQTLPDDAVAPARARTRSLYDTYVHQWVLLNRCTLTSRARWWAGGPCCASRSPGRTRWSRTPAATRSPCSRRSQLGSIEAGKLADLVVLDRDYFTVPADEIKDIGAVLTVSGGRIAYDGRK